MVSRPPVLSTDVHMVHSSHVLQPSSGPPSTEIYPLFSDQIPLLFRTLHIPILCRIIQSVFAMPRKDVPIHIVQASIHRPVLRP